MKLQYTCRYKSPFYILFWLLQNDFIPLRDRLRRSTDPDVVTHKKRNSMTIHATANPTGRIQDFVEGRVVDQANGNSKFLKA